MSDEISRQELEEELEVFRRENYNLNDDELVEFLDSFLTPGKKE